MKTRSLVLMLLLLLAVVITVKFDLARLVKIGFTNIMYGDEMRAVNGCRIHVEIRNPDLERRGLTGEAIRASLTSAFSHAGITVLPDHLWEKTPGQPSFNVQASAVKQPEGDYQYVVSMDLSRNVSKGITGTRNNRIIWASSKMGDGQAEDIRKEIDEITDVFLKARSGD